MHSSALPLNFTTFYVCGIKPFTKFSQKNCVNRLLNGVYPTPDNSYNVLSDSVCSNYVKGQKSIKDELRIDLLSQSIDSLKTRIDNIGIQDPMLSASALHNLIKFSNLQPKTKSTLLKAQNFDEPLDFIARVFIQAIRATDVRPLNTEEQGILNSCIHGDIVLQEESKSFNEAISPDKYAFTSSAAPRITSIYAPTADDEEDTEYLTDYLSPAFANDSTEFMVKATHIDISPVNMPMDYRALVHTLKPALTSNNAIKTFTFQEFLNAMSINEHSGTVHDGSLSCLILHGSLESICTFIKKINFTLVSDFSCQLIGHFTLDESKEILCALQLASNKHVNILSSLIYVADAPELELRLVAHTCSNKVEMQKRIDDEGVPIYYPKKH